MWWSSADCPPRFPSIQMKDKMATQAMLQREIQMSINIAKARDSLMWFGSLYAVVVTGATLGVIARRPVPHIIGWFALSL